MPSSTAARQPVIKVEEWGVCLNTADDHTDGGMSWMPRRRTRRAPGMESNRSHGVLYDFPSQTDQNSNKRYEMEFLMQGWSVADFRKKMKNWICYWVGKVELDLVRTSMMAFLYVYGNYICLFIIVLLTHPTDPRTNRLYGTGMEVPIQLAGAY